MSTDAKKQARINNLPDESEYDWENFKVKYNKSYSSPDEEEKRRQLFLEKVVKIKETNAKYVEGTISFISGVNHMTDWTSEEQSKLCGARIPQ